MVTYFSACSSVAFVVVLEGINELEPEYDLVCLDYFCECIISISCDSCGTG